jgi:hypothetical protein
LWLRVWLVSGGACKAVGSQAELAEPENQFDFPKTLFFRTHFGGLHPAKMR